MEVLLKENVDYLGDKGELVTVKDGYGRNFLIPQGKAILATAAVKKMHAENTKQSAHKAAKVLEEANASAEKLKAATIKIAAKVGEAGKIFGSVTAVQVAEAIKTTGVEVDRKKIKILGSDIKQVGKYTANVKLHREVAIDVDFEVVGE